MKKTFIFVALLIGTFFLGVAFQKVNSNSKKDDSFKRVTGIGGIFFKAKDPQKLTEWYKAHLGLETNPYGATFEWYEGKKKKTKAETQWTPFPTNTDYFAPSQKDYMINYRVADLTQLVDSLKAEGVEIVDEMEVYDFGKFIHILDLEGNKIQLWEPINN